MEKDFFDVFPSLKVKKELEELLVELRLRIPDEIKKYQKIISNQEAILSAGFIRSISLNWKNR